MKPGFSAFSMRLGRVMVVMAAGLGVTWAANQVTSERGPVLAQAQAPGVTEQKAEDLSPEEIEAELRRIEQATGGSGDELEEFVPEKPLAADLPIDFPSDI